MKRPDVLRLRAELKALRESCLAMEVQAECVVVNKGAEVGGSLSLRFHCELVG